MMIIPTIDLIVATLLAVFCLWGVVPAVAAQFEYRDQDRYLSLSTLAMLVYAAFRVGAQAIGQVSVFLA